MPRFVVPPGWPPPPEGWEPPRGWKPEPQWGPPPVGWSFWQEDDHEAEPAATTPETSKQSGVNATFSGKTFSNTEATVNT